MADIPASCYARHLSPPRPVEYRATLSVLLSRGVLLTVVIEWHQPDRLASLDDDEVIAAIEDVIPGAVREKYPMLAGEDIEDVAVREVQETL